jgi:hypothetical protein
MDVGGTPKQADPMSRPDEEFEARDEEERRQKRKR